MKKNSSSFHRIINKLLKWSGIVLLIALLSSMQQPPVAHALTITVNSINDVVGVADGQCTLREAITNANNGGDSTGGDCDPGVATGLDIITLPSGNYVLDIIGTEDDINAYGDLDITDDIEINGSGAGITIIDGDDAHRVIHTHGSSTVSLNNLTIQDGSIGTLGDNSSSGSFGGGIYRQSSGNMALDSVELLSNMAGHRGGGIENGNATGTVTLTSCTVSGNSSGYGGGLVSATSGATTTVTNSTFYNNSATFNGGGLNIYDAGIVNVDNSTFINNSAANGGGLANGGYSGAGHLGTLTITNTTISNNSATNGGGIYTHTDSTTAVSNSTITSSVSDSGLYNNGSTITVDNSIVSGSTTGNCVGAITNNGNNLEYPNTTCGGFTVQANPLLSALADNGGSTQTHLLANNSPAIDAGGSCGVTNDQRNEPRADYACDIGAIELQLSDFDTIIKNVAQGSTYTFGSTIAQVTIVDDGSGCLTGLSVQRTNSNHPEATITNLQTGVYWDLSPVGCTSGFIVTLTLPTPNFTPDADDKLCRYDTDSSSWDCGEASAHSFGSATMNDSSTIDTITRTGVIGFSEWTPSAGVDPTAVSFQSITAANQPAGWIILLFSILMLIMGGLWLRRAKC